MRNLWIISFVSIFVLVSSVYAHMESLSVEEMINSMIVEQNVSSISMLDCSTIPDSEFEELGNSMMGRMIGDDTLHEQMDAMMGGEGSVSLRQMHISMGKNWLGCGSEVQGMMGSNMMPMMMRMMGNYYPAYYSSYNIVLILAIVGWSLLILLIVVKVVLTSTGKIKITKMQKRR